MFGLLKLTVVEKGRFYKLLLLLRLKIFNVKFFLNLLHKYIGNLLVFHFIFNFNKIFVAVVVSFNLEGDYLIVAVNNVLVSLIITVSFSICYATEPMMFIMEDCLIM